MSIAAPHLDAQLAQTAVGSDFRSRDFAGSSDGVPVLERLPEAVSPARQSAPATRVPSPSITPANPGDLSARMQLLVQIEGSATAIARRCGFSEEAVRDWCHGRSDISREHCVIVARTLGISLGWLVDGEGSLRDTDDSTIRASMPRITPARTADDATPAETEAHIIVDPDLLAAAFRVLQSYIGLVGGSLSQTQRADALAQIYHVLGHTGSPGHADRMVALHSLLGGYFCSRKSLIG